MEVAVGARVAVAVGGIGVGVLVLVGVASTGVDVGVLVGGTDVAVGTWVGGTGVGVLVSNGSVVGSSSEEQALKPTTETTAMRVTTVSAMIRAPTRDNRAGRVLNDFNADIKS